MSRLGTLGSKFHLQRPLPTSSRAAARADVGAIGARSPFSCRQDLVDALKLTGRGDQAAFRRLYAATSVKLFGIIVRILGRRDLAEEVLQEVYIRVWQRAVDFDPAITSPMTWLVTIARNRALDETRRKTSRSLEDCPEFVHASSNESPLPDHERNENHLRLMACLDRLGPDERKAVVAAYHYGMTREEIARSTNRPVATVKTWLRRSLARIKD
jgi:RNA polymerase sigma-70 factor (ECF subfamily)